MSVDDILIGTEVPDHLRDCIAIGLRAEAKELGTLNFAWGTDLHVQIVTHANGRVELPNGMRLDEAVEGFWKCVAGMNPLQSIHSRLVDRFTRLLYTNESCPEFRIGDRVRMRRTPEMAGLIQSIQAERFESDTGAITVHEVFVRGHLTGWNAMDYELEYDPLEQLARV